MQKTDVLIIGSGVAGLTCALKLAMARPDKHITILTKAEEAESNTRYAQGGVAAVWNFEKDSFDKHIQDTLTAGDGLCEREVVDFVVKEGPERVREIINWGADFDKGSQGNYKLGREGGHSEYRVLHHKDVTGSEIENTLLKQVHDTENIRLLSHHFVVDLITQHHLGRLVTRHSTNIECYGAYMLNLATGRIEKTLAGATVLASGGGGQAYKATTNPVIATGDGIAMVYRAKGRIGNMEFIQFHPTSLYDPEENPSFLISEAVRGAGAVLRTIDGKEFMNEYDERGSLAPRDIVARAIDNELKKRGDDFVNLDCSSINAEEMQSHFPNILQKCLDKGIDVLAGDMIPVVPAAHYMCGGVRIDHWGRTSIRKLYACGECTNSGLHGANRLASNSLLEALVFSHRIYEHLFEKMDELEIKEGIPSWDAASTTAPKEMVLITQSLRELKEIMTSYVGIVRSDVRLKRALSRLELLWRETEELYNSTLISPQLCELRNLITIGFLISRSASFRRESRGLHFTTDYPAKINFAEDSLV